MSYTPSLFLIPPAGWPHPPSSSSYCSLLHHLPCNFNTPRVSFGWGVINKRKSRPQVSPLSCFFSFPFSKKKKMKLNFVCCHLATDANLTCWLVGFLVTRQSWTRNYVLYNLPLTSPIWYDKSGDVSLVPQMPSSPVEGFSIYFLIVFFHTQKRYKWK